MDYDVVIVGCGVAGLSTALKAAEEGAKVAVLERSTKDVRGGNSRYTEAYFRMPSETEISEDFEERLVENSAGSVPPGFLRFTLKPYDQWPPILKGYGFTDPQLIGSFAEGVVGTVAWLKGFGIKFIESSPFVTQITTRMAPVGGGEALVEALAPAAEGKGVTFHYETTAQSLIQNERGNIKGVRVWSNREGYKDFTSKAVVLASGGFQGNLEMMTKYVGSHAHLTRPVAPGGLYNKGEGIEMALSVGAAPAGQYDAFHAETVDPRSEDPEPSIFIFPYCILVNKLGKRFIDEGFNLSDLSYEEIARTIFRQPGGIAYCIYDSKIEKVPVYEKGIRTDKGPIKAKSIKEMAVKLEIEPSSLEETMRNYNAAVQDGNFDPLTLDGKCTKGIEPPKSNWAMTIDETDLMALPIVCANVFTFGGIKVTPHAEVVNKDGYIIPGLYAAGEVMGFYYGSYVGSTSVLRGLVFGRKAGEHSAKFCKKAG
jgi:tricarballylate dehydrogenase